MLADKIGLNGKDKEKKKVQWKILKEELMKMIATISYRKETLFDRNASITS